MTSESTLTAVPSANDPDAVLVAERVDSRPRARRLLAPLATLAGTAAAVGYLAAVAPTVPVTTPCAP